MTIFIIITMLIVTLYSIQQLTNKENAADKINCIAITIVSAAYNVMCIYFLLEMALCKI